MSTLQSEEYIEKVLGHLPSEFEERDEIAMEIRSTIAERTAAGESVWQTIDQLGTPLELAESYLQDIEMEPASFGVRVIAKLIDLMIPFAFFLLLLFGGIGGLGMVRSFGSSGLGFGLGFLSVMGFAVAFWGLLLLYPALAEWRFERTLGKHLLGLRVARESGARISIGQALVRQLPWLVFQGLWIVDALFALFNEKHQRAAEMLSHTQTILKR